MTYEEREAHPHRLVNYLSGTQYYECSTVNRGRKEKQCTACGGIIQKGEPAFNLKFYGYDGEYPVNPICIPCTEDEGTADIIDQILSHKFDTEH